MKFLQVKNIGKYYGSIKALDGVDFDLELGEVHGLIGENGAGKSTLVKILSGVETPSSGEIYINDNRYKHLSPSISIDCGISVIYQDISLFPNLSVAENIVLGSKKNTQFINWKETCNTAKKILYDLNMSLSIDVLLCSLPLAKQQLVAIARAVLLDARVVIMDEPTSSLSHGEVNTLFRIINDMRQRGISIIFISHKLDELMEICDRYTILRDGKSMGTFVRDDLDEKKLIYLMAGRDIEYVIYEKSTTAGEEILKVSELSKKGHYADISFSLYKHEILGIYGLVGSGRSELMHSIYGLTHQDTGKVYLWNTLASIQSPQDACKLGLGYISENRLLDGILLRKGMLDNIHLTSNALKKSFLKRNRKQEEKEVNVWVNKLNIHPSKLDLEGSAFSGGNQQKIVVAKWLHIHPKIIIVDEPTHGIDIETKTEIHKILRELSKEGVGVIVVSSELPEVIAISDRVIVMRRGRLVKELQGKEISAENIMRNAAIGLTNIS